MDRTFLLLGAVAAFLAVTLGAFGAHGLRGRLSPEMMAVFQTGVQYHMAHALALILVSAMMGRMGGWLIQTAGWSFLAGIVLFSGSLYVLVDQRHHDPRRDHADRRPRVPDRLGVPRLRGVLITIERRARESAENAVSRQTLPRGPSSLASSVLLPVLRAFVVSV